MSCLAPEMRVPPLPPEYEYLREVISHGAPMEGELRDALDIYLMSLSLLGSGAWGDEHLGQCLAWGWMTAFNEACVLSSLRVSLVIASYRFAIRGGCLVQWDLFRKWVSPRVRELWALGAETPWLPALMEKYKIEHWRKINYREWCDPEMMEKAIVRVDITARTRTRQDAARVGDDVPINCRIRRR